MQFPTSQELEYLREHCASPSARRLLLIITIFIALDSIVVILVDIPLSSKEPQSTLGPGLTSFVIL
ncbi:hypothetical protein HDU76_011638, partial [Blyttiomyces sp. JEL0837]